MKILNFFMHPLFPVKAGNQSNTMEFCKILEKNGHKITLMYIDYDDKTNDKLIKKHTKEPFETIFSVPFFQKTVVHDYFRKFKNKVRLLLGKSPITNHYNPGNEIKKSVQNFLLKNDYDLVVVHYIFATDFLIPLLKKNTKTILFTHGLISLEYKRFYPFLPKLWHQRNKLLEYEIFNNYDKIMLVSDYEKEILVSDEFPLKKILLSGVASKTIKTIRNTIRDIDLLFVSGSGKHNVDGIKFFLNKIFPLIKKKYKNIKFVCAGTICQNIFIKNNRDIEKLGYIEDLETIYSRAKIVINPVYNGVGVKVKTVEALAHGSLVITTPNGSEGIRGLSDDLLFVCDSNESWINSITKILEKNINVESYRKNILLWSQNNFKSENVFSETLEWINTLN